MIYRLIKLCLIGLAVSVLGLGCGADRLAGGTNDETHTEFAARFVEPSGIPVADAVVQVVLRDSTSVFATGLTDQEGHPVVAALPDGLYTISVSKGGLVGFVDSVPVSGGRLLLLRDDTLGPVGSLGGVVALQPNHDPASVTVCVMGTNINTNVGTDGRFRLEGMGSGRFRLRFVTTLSDYTTTYVLASAADGAALLLPDTVRMPYTGIPIVTGLAVANDTLTGDLTVSWSPVAYRFLQDYVIYRDTVGALSPSRLRYAATSDTAWRDTAAAGNLVVAKWKYRVVVETMTGDTGRWFGFAAGTSIPREVSQLEHGTWTNLGRGNGGQAAVLGNRLAEVVVGRETGVVRVGVRTSSQGLLWDSAGIDLPSTVKGQAIEWVVGVGAGRVWCLGHSALGDGVYVRSSLDGATWAVSTLPDSLWPAGAGERVLWGGAAQAVLVSQATGKAMVYRDTTWTKTRVPAQILGADDSALLTMGGGSHLLSVAWTDRTGVLADHGPWVYVAPTQVVVWNGKLAVLAAGRLWIQDSAGWTLRSKPGLRSLAVYGDQLYLSDAGGGLWLFRDLP